MIQYTFSQCYVYDDALRAQRKGILGKVSGGAELGNVSISHPIKDDTGYAQAEGIDK